MTSKEAIKYYEDEAKREEIRSGCSQDKAFKTLHNVKAKKLRRAAEAIRKLFGRSYHKAAFTLDDNLD